jgi:hypothetical protein
VGKGKLVFDKIQKDKVLLVEGMDEVYFFNDFFKKAITPEYLIQIIPFEGIDKFPNFIRSLKNMPGFTMTNSIGIIRDTEEDANAAFQSVQDALEKAGFPKPFEPLKTVGDKPKITVMILPDKDTKGALESMLLKTIKDKEEFRCVEGFIDCLKQNSLIKSEYTTARIAKAKIHTFIASKEKPELQVGQATQAGYWGDFSSPVFNPLKKFLQML